LASWPECGQDLLVQLRREPGQLALTVSDPDDRVAGACAALQRTSTYPARARLLLPAPPTNSREVINRLAAAGPVIVDLDLARAGL
jgi:hypothetical protein